MDASRSARQWVPADAWLNAIDNAQAVVHRPRVRPVNPASDDECYEHDGRLPDTRKRRQERGRHLTRAQAETAARKIANQRSTLSGSLLLQPNELLGDS